MFVRHERGLQLIALFEAFKGGLVLILGLGLLSLLDKDAEEVAERLVAHLHLNPASHYPRIFIEAAAKLTDSRLWLFATLAFLYSVFRFVEAYGLWHVRHWAEWVALVSGCMYMPLEIYELIKGLTWIRISAFVLNILVVIYLAAVLMAQRQARLEASQMPDPG
jgi:uncharacterized membrane protein (DUF2068 family)